MLAHTLQVTVQIVRVFGVSGRIEVTYSTQDKTAQGNFDFRSIDRDVVIMQPGQATANLSIPVSGLWIFFWGVWGGGGYT